MKKYSVYRINTNGEHWEASFADPQKACDYANNHNMIFTGDYNGSEDCNYIVKTED